MNQMNTTTTQKRLSFQKNGMMIKGQKEHRKMKTDWAYEVQVLRNYFQRALDESPKNYAYFKELKNQVSDLEVLMSQLVFKQNPPKQKSSYSQVLGILLRLENHFYLAQQTRHTTNIPDKASLIHQIKQSVTTAWN